jgi:hypothetical protein
MPARVPPQESNKAAFAGMTGTTRVPSVEFVPLADKTRRESAASHSREAQLTVCNRLEIRVNHVIAYLG